MPPALNNATELTVQRDVETVYLSVSEKTPAAKRLYESGSSFRHRARLQKTFRRIVSRVSSVVAALRETSDVEPDDRAMLIATCHCGAVGIEVARRPRSLTQCTCSICRRYGALWAYCTRRTARVLNDAGVETAYRWNDEVIDFYHCNTCGCMTRYESVEKSIDGRIAVNARMIGPEEIDGIRIRTFDGADTWKYLD